MVIIDDVLSIASWSTSALFPIDADGPVVTTYAWQLRYCQSLAIARFSASGAHHDLLSVLGLDSESVREWLRAGEPASWDSVLDSRPAAAHVSELRAEKRNLLAAETVALALHHGASVRLSPPNSSGHVRDACLAYGVDVETWAIVPQDDGTFVIA